MKRFISVIFFLIFLITSLFFVAAHPGGTDSSGGHYNRSTGKYHYHHGYSAHQHPNGECPYDFDNKTGGSSGYRIEKDKTTTKKATTTQKETKEEGEKENKTNFTGLYILVAIILAPMVYSGFESLKNRFFIKKADSIAKKER